MRKKRKYKPYQVFCSAEDESVIETIRKFATNTHSGFREPKSPNLIDEIESSPAFCFFLDWNAYQSIRIELDEQYEEESIKPLIYLVGKLPFYTPNNLSDWIHIFNHESTNELLRDMNVVRSRIRS